MTKLSLSAMEKLMKEAGAERVAINAKKKLRELLEKEAKSISESAIKFARYKGRVTVQSDDIERAKNG